ncbi:MAG: VOC family protein [Arenicellales bacterium]|nr:VOC family protein [Arenicellales bacterium]
MTTQVIGIDHIYISVTDMEAAESYYDKVMTTLGFKKNQFDIGDVGHIQYFNRHFGYVIRPATTGAPPHNRYHPGLHHFCFRVDTREDVTGAANKLRALGIDCSEPQDFPEYAEDYYAVFLSDPDGIKLEITNYREERRFRHDYWEQV